MESHGLGVVASYEAHGLGAKGLGYGADWAHSVVDDDDALLGHIDTGSLKYLTWYNAPGDGDWLTQTHSNLLTNENLDHMMGKYTDPNNVTFDPFFMLDLHRPGPRSEPWWIQPKQWDQPGGGLRPGWDVDMAGELEKALPHIVSGKVVGIFLG